VACYNAAFSNRAPGEDYVASIGSTRRFGPGIFVVVLIAILLCAPTSVADSPEEKKKKGGFRDPVDGKFDMSASLLDRRGFLPVPNVITEPALGGFGLGLFLGFFHAPKGDDGIITEEAVKRTKKRPPSVTGVGGAYTANDSWLAGGGHFGSWKKDHIRYSGVLGLASLNLDFYRGDQSLGFNIDGFFLLQDVKVRLKNSNWFVGGRWTYLDSTINLDLGLDIDPDRLPPQLRDGFKSKDSGIGANVYYDSRDNIFTPDRGQEALIRFSVFDEALGGDFDYRSLELTATTYHPVHQRVVLGARFTGQGTDGDPPFYAWPYIHLRGVPALRYQGKNAGSVEVEARWRVAGRWSVVGFTGVGSAGGLELLPDYTGIWAGGVGGRYLIARRVGMHAGIDAATSGDDSAVYFVFGTNWR
jgi:hypothetical protein